MLVYHYDPRTYAYLGATEADKDPLEDGNYLVPAHATASPPPTPIEGQRLVFGGTSWALVDVPAPVEEPQASEAQVPDSPEQKAEAARLRRDQLLRASDWRMMPDVTESMQPQTLVELYAYRQALRDVTKQPEFPEIINWPELA